MFFDDSFQFLYDWPNVRWLELVFVYFTAEKCSCIPHLLRTLVFIIQHVTDSDVAFPASELRSKLLIQVFRLSLSILKARREPWLTFINSPSDVNRLFTILTAISEATIPETLSHQIDGNYQLKFQFGFGFILADWFFVCLFIFCFLFFFCH